MIFLLMNRLYCILKGLSRYKEGSRLCLLHEEAKTVSYQHFSNSAKMPQRQNMELLQLFPYNNTSLDQIMKDWKKSIFLLLLL